MEDWKVVVKNRVDQFLTDIWIIRKVHSGDVVVFIPKGNDIVEEITVKRGDAVPPTLTIPTDLLPTLMDALQKKGVKPPEDSFTKGKLEATECHLGDLRQLLKLK